VAVKAFFRALALGRTRLKAYTLQDTLRLLQLWFRAGERLPVQMALQAGLSSNAVSSELWLAVVPQLIARIAAPGQGVRRLLHSLLNSVGAAHPQGLVYPLTVAAGASNPVRARREAAQAVLAGLRSRAPLLCDQAELVSREMIRLAIMWAEEWVSALEDASRVYFGDGNIPGMMAILLPLHNAMKSPGPQTLRETAFVQTYARELDSAHRLLLGYRDSPNPRQADLGAAWDIYYRVFKSINKTIPYLQSLDLASASPGLLNVHDLLLGVPGTYSPGAPVIRIMSVCPHVDIINSKQRPRKVVLAGSDGRLYGFLLKGHEDLRQDERVMQLFGLVNTLLANDHETGRRDFSIRRYAVTPLSHTAGLVGWVPNCDTLHALIRFHREAKHVPLNIEHKIMVSFSQSFESCPPLAKVEIFRHALESTEGTDLSKMLWLRSPSSEIWLERRTAYTRSLGVMSIVGYILGLGDRHPSNIMLDRGSGKLLHIDFGGALRPSTPPLAHSPALSHPRPCTPAPPSPPSHAKTLDRKLTPQQHL
jgi:FKBP12-rapamycin complex-associated protein